MSHQNMNDAMNSGPLHRLNLTASRSETFCQIPPQHITDKVLAEGIQVTVSPFMERSYFLNCFD